MNSSPFSAVSKPFTTKPGVSRLAFAAAGQRVVPNPPHTQSPPSSHQDLVEETSLSHGMPTTR